MQSKPENITLISSESKSLVISVKSAKRAKLIQDFFNDFPYDEMNLNLFDYATLNKIKDYLDHYKDIEPKEILFPLPNKDFKNCVDDWDLKYINLDNIEDIFKIMNAANFLNIEPLVNLTCAKIASLIKGKNPAEIRNLFNLSMKRKD